MTRLTQRVLIALPLIILAFGALGAWLRTNDDPFRGDAVVHRPFPSLTYGIQTFLWWDDGYTGLILDWVNMIGFNHIKQTFAWRDLESQPGEWNFSHSDRFMAEVEQRNLRVVARLGQVPGWATTTGIISSDKTDAPPQDITQWENYCRTVSEYYAGRIVAYQIWNEPNLSREWGNNEPDPAAYVELLRVCSHAIRQADPNAIIISAGLAPTGNHDAIAYRDDIYLSMMYDAGFQNYVDVVGVHAPGFSPPDYSPDQAEQDGNARWATFRRVEDLRKIMVERGDAARQMAILEVGWTTDTRNPDYAWFAVTQEEQAQYIVEAYNYAVEHWRPWVGLMSLIYMPKSSWTSENEEWWWAIVEPMQTPRPAFFELILMGKTCDDFEIPASRPMSQEEYSVRVNACP